MSFALTRPEVPKRLLQISKEICAAGGRAYLVGGFVRDALLGRPSRDFDVEVYDIEQDALLAILKKFGRPNLVGKAFGVIHLVMHGLEMDFSFPRTENKIGSGHRGFLVETHLHLTFEEAARRRDFTVNAMGLSLPDFELSDPYDGKGDLERKILRHVSSAFSEDSLRILRGVQFASRFGLSLAPETAELCRSLSLNDLSPERIYDEFRKWLLKPGAPSFGLKAFREMDLSRFFPEVRPLNGSDEMLGQFLDKISSRLPEISDQASRAVLAFAALLAGSQKGEAKTFLAKMTNEVQLLKRVPLLCDFVPRLLERATAGFSDEFLRRASVEQNGLSLALIYLESTPVLGPNVRESAAKNFREKSLALGVLESPPEPFLKGADLLGMGMKPGREVGKILKDSFERQLSGQILSREQALDFAQEIISSGKA